MFVKKKPGRFSAWKPSFALLKVSDSSNLLVAATLKPDKGHSTFSPNRGSMTHKQNGSIYSFISSVFSNKKRICNKFRCTVFLYIILRVGCTWGVQYFGIPCLSLAHRNRTGDMPPTAPSMPASTAAAHHSMAEVLHYLSWVGSPVIPLLLLGVRYHISHLQDFFDKSTVSQSFLKEEKFTTTVRI